MAHATDDEEAALDPLDEGIPLQEHAGMLHTDENQDRIFRAVCIDPSDEAKKAFVPYVNYVITHLERDEGVYWGRNNPRSINFFISLANFFSNHPDRTLASFIEEKRNEIVIGDQADIAPAAMECFSLWTMIKSLKHIEVNADARSTPIRDLLRITNRLPAHSVPSGPPYEILCRKLNASILASVCRFDLQWTDDLASHLVLDNNVLQIFAMPAKLWGATNKENDPERALQSMGLPISYCTEIRLSYGRLFSSRKARSYIKRIGLTQDDKRLHAINLAGLEHYSRTNEHDAWEPENFGHLWSRIKLINDRAIDRGADNFWKVLFRDRRNTTAYWGFMVAFVALALTLIQTITSIVQTVKGFV